MEKQNYFEVECYDKDNDLYEMSSQFDTLEEAVKECQLRDDKINQELLKSSSNEPFDWCVITEYKNGKVFNTYTYANGKLIGMKDKIKDFCFDTIADFIDPENILIEQDRFGKWKVLVLRGLKCPHQVIYDEWTIKTKNTEFENIPLYVPVNH